MMLFSPGFYRLLVKIGTKYGPLLQEKCVIMDQFGNTAPCNMRVVFTTDQKGTLRFVRRQLWMWESGWKSRKKFSKEGSERIGF